MRRERVPDKFDGEKNEWVDYYRHFETVANWNHWDEHEKAMQLAMSLQGEAQRILGDIPPWIQADYQALVKELNDRFNPSERETAYRFEFRNRTRASNETPMTFGYSLRRLAAKAFPETSLNDREYWIIDQFINGLGNLETKKSVLYGHPKNLNEAIALATEAESFDSMPKDRFSRKPHVNNYVSKEYAGGVSKLTGDETETDKILKEMKDLLAKTNQELESLKVKVNNSQGFPRQNVQNYERFHTQGYQKQGSSSEKNGTNKPSFSDRKIVCYLCHEEGHYRRSCPQLQAKLDFKGNSVQTQKARSSENTQEN